MIPAYWQESKLLMSGFKVPNAVPLHDDWEIPANGVIQGVRLIAKGKGIRQVQDLVGPYGGKRKHWKKYSGMTTIRNGAGEEKRTEVRWYECHGIGRVSWKEKLRGHEANRGSSLG